MNDPIKRALSKALQKVDPHLARIASEPDTDVHRYDQSLFKNHEIYEVVYAGPYRPISFYAGYAPDRQAWILTGAPENFVRLARAESLSMDSADMAERYAVAFFEVTRPTSERVYLVRSIDDVEFLPRVTEEDAAAAASTKERLRAAIAPPQVKSAEAGYHVVLYAVHDQSLERRTLHVASDGGVRSTVETLDENLPLLYGI